MESMLIWVVVFAGAIVGIFGTLLLASEKDLRAKKRRVEELEDMLAGAPTTPPQSSDLQGADDRASQRENLLAEISELTSRLDSDRVKIEELEANQARLGALESEARELRERNQRLEDEGTELKEELRAGRTRISEAEDRDREGAETQLRFEAEIVALKEQLEESRAKVRELESAQERVVDLESRESEFKESQYRLEVEIDELKTRLVVNQENVQELETTRTRLSEMDQRHREVNDENMRLRERLSGLKDHLAKGTDYGPHLQATRERLHDLQAQQAELTERSRQLQDELSEVKSLLDSTSEAMVQHNLFEMPAVDKCEEDGNPDLAYERCEPDSDPDEKSMIEPGKNHPQPVRPEEELARLESVLARDPNNREARLCHLLASVQLYNVYAYEKEINAIKDMKELSEKERIAARDIFLLRANEAQKRGRDDEMLRYRAWAKNVVFRTPFGTSSAENATAIEDGAQEDQRASGRKNRNDSQSTVEQSAATANDVHAAKAPEAKHVHVIFMAMIIVILLAGVLAAGFLSQDSGDNGIGPQAQIEATPALQLPAAEPELSVAARDPLNENTAESLATTVEFPASHEKSAPEQSTRTINPSKKNPDTRRPAASAVASAGSPKKSQTAARTAQRVSGKYRVVQATKVHSAASENSRTLANLDPGIQVNVVDARDGWLEIRSRHGRPPGFIKVDTAVRVENLDVSLLPNRENSTTTKTP